MNADSFGWSPPQQFDDFIIEKPLGKGAMGLVYLAHDKHLDRPVAIKFIASLAPNSTERKRFLIEARSAARLNHPNVVTIYRVGEVDGKLYLASEFIQGMTLDKVDKPLPWQEVVRIGKELARGLSAAHKAGVLHRDIKPANAIRTVDGSVKLLDFGLAKVLSDQETPHTPEEVATSLATQAALPETVPPKNAVEDSHDTAHGEEFDQTFASGKGKDGKSGLHEGGLQDIANITRPGTVMGTPYYMAPELWTGAAATPQSDIYALAALLYELLTGLPPSHAILSEGDVQKLRTEELPPLSQKTTQLSPRLAEVIEQGLRIDVEQRPRSSDQFLDELQAIPTDEHLETLFAPSAQTQDRRTNLPEPGSGVGVPLIGRRRELQELQSRYSTSRCITVRGTAGTGKTLLASHFARGKVQELASTGGTWFCDLQACRTIDDLCAVVAEVLQISVNGARDNHAMIELLGHAMAGRGRLLIVLDNFEQLIEHAATTLQVWLSLAPDVRFIVTSRIATRIADEAIFDLMPLPVPDITETDPVVIARADAVQLFMERARNAARHWVPSAADAATIATIVRRLDGIPLAIELCAARAAILKPSQILERLEKRFALLRDSNRSAEDRQATLINTIEWSWNLLDIHEQAALAQCAVFRGGFSLEAAEKVLMVDDPLAPAVMDLLQALQDKSLVHHQRSTDGHMSMRFTLFESIREFAAAKLTSSGQQSAIESAHAQFFVEWAEPFASQVTSALLMPALTQLSMDLDNLIEVVRRGETAGATLCARAALAADAYLDVRSSPSVQLENIKHALQHASGLSDEHLLARMSLAAGRTLHDLGRLNESEKFLSEALKHAEAIGSSLQSEILVRLANLHSQLPECMEQAFSEMLRASELAENSSNRWLQAFVVGNRGILEFRAGRPDTARDMFFDAHRRFREVGDSRYLAIFSHNIGGALLEEGRLDESREKFEEAAALHTQLRDERHAGISLSNLSWLSLHSGEFSKARRQANDALAMLRKAGDRIAEAVLDGTIACIEQAEGKLQQSLAHLNHSLELFGDSPETADKLFVEAFKALVLGLMNQRTEAEKHLKRVQTDASNSGDNNLICMVEILHGIFASIDGDATEAKRCLLLGQNYTQHGATYFESSANVRLVSTILAQMMDSAGFEVPQQILPRQASPNRAERGQAKGVP